MTRTRAKAASIGLKKVRLALPQSKKPVFESLGDGVSIGYRRNLGTGTWIARRADGKGGSNQHVIGFADDYEEADGVGIFSWAQAQARAFDWAKSGETVQAVPLIVTKALDAYEADLVVRGGDGANARRARMHLPPRILGKAVAELSRDDLKDWRDGLAKMLAPATVNRVCNGLKAALNLAADGNDRIISRNAWEKGLASIPDAERARNIILPDSEVEKLIRAAYRQSEQFGLLVEVAAVTGSRYSQIAGLTIGDLQDGSGDPRLMMPTSRKGRGQKKVLRRPVPITSALACKLRSAAGTRAATEPLLIKPSGAAWAHSDHARPFARAAKAASLDGSRLAPYGVDEVTIYALRHSSIVRQALRGVPLRVVAALHDTSVVMIERTYSANISDHADAIARAALQDFSVKEASAAESPPTEAVPLPGRCRHGHSYAEHPPYRNKNGSIVCSACARERARRNRVAKRT